MPRREIIRPEGMPVPHPSFTPALRYDDWLFTSGLMATDFATGLAPEARGNPAVPLAGDDPLQRESRHLLALLARACAAGGTDLGHVVRIDQFPTSRDVVDAYNIERDASIPAPRPASTSVVIDGLMVPACHTEVEILAIRPGGGLTRETVESERILAPRGGYSPVIRAGDFLFLAGQMATDFRSGVAPEARLHPQFWGGNAMDRQARYTLDNIAVTLEAAGSSMANVVHVGVYLTDITDLPRLDRVWREYFPEDPPARTIFPVNGMATPEGRVEITVIALRDGAATQKQVIHTSRAPDPLFHEAQAVRAGEFLFVSSQLAADAGGLVASARVNPDYPYALDSSAEQIRVILENAAAICAEAGTELRHTLRMTTLHTDLREYASSVGVRRGYFPDGQPTTTTLGVRGPLQVPGCTVSAAFWVGYP